MPPIYLSLRNKEAFLEDMLVVLGSIYSDFRIENCGCLLLCINETYQCRLRGNTYHACAVRHLAAVADQDPVARLC